MDLEELREESIKSSIGRKGVCDLIPEGASRILEVGCGWGGILLRLQRDKGCTELCGVDMDPEAARRVGPFIDRVELRDIEHDEIFSPEYKGFFKYIILHDVVEHLYDPWLTMARIREFLADDGRLIVATPNLHYWALQHEILSGRFPYGPGLWHTGHLRWYTPVSLLNILSIGGFQVNEYYLEITSEVDMKALGKLGKLQEVQFPPVELQARYPDKPVFTVTYPKNIRQYYVTFFGQKLIAVCGKGHLFWNPQPATYNCPLVKQLTESVGNPYDVFNPPPMRPIQPGYFPS
ncbi:class I SAM-dependent methyltransferase [uncultured Pseudodesulfovibrio sp.]|uniref:class I SAM-dependent methyltransferase n=1 Tax=uncultured Pseudodesulfovibrio sp. TaxID=2035858 RepID=UPI0029C68A44|nr:class I SAM-dependent methyltransferase [uncultured Pseudodesulfovibrio sp.]